MRGSESVNNRPVRVYDNGGKTVDRYTVVFTAVKHSRVDHRGFTLYECLAMNAVPFHPQGFGQHSEAMLGAHLGKRIPFASLPEDCQKCAMRDLTCE